MLEEGPTTPVASMKRDREQNLTENKPELHVLPLDQVVPSPSNPRQEMDGSGLKQLKASIHETAMGLLQPITVRRLSKDQYEIVAGYRRYTAISELHKEHPADPRYKGIKALVYTVANADMPVLQLVENLHRADLTPVEIAASVAATLETGFFDQATLCQQLGWSDRTFRRYDQLHRAPIYIKDLAKYVEVEEEVASADGEMQAKKVRKPGFDFSVLLEFIVFHGKLKKHDAAKLKEDGSYRPIAEKIIMRLATKMALQGWSLATLKQQMEQIAAKYLDQSSPAEKAPKGEKAAYYRQGNRLTLDASRTDLPQSERARIAAELTEVLKAMGFKTVAIQG
ncbi:MAG: ParB/RepB/Spo0J family partition protein [Myxococcota bacterium]